MESQPTNPETASPGPTGPPAAPPKPKKRRGLNRRGGLAQAAENWMLANAPEMLEKLAAAINGGLDKREKTSMEMASRLLLGDKGPDGVNVLHQNLTINTTGDQGGARSLESIVRRLEVKDSLKVLPAPTPIRQGADILDAEEV